jgi:hypothetical protein
MKHTLVFDREEAADIVFKCTRCLKEIGFNRPGFGEPSPVLRGQTWQMPDDPDQWMDPCISPEQPARDVLAGELETGTKTSLSTEDARLIARALRGL